MSIEVAELRPDERRLLDGRAEIAEWPPGRTFVARDGGGLAACRVADASVADGYHREHVRELRVSGEARLAAACVRAGVEACASEVRVEAWVAQHDAAVVEACSAAGLEVEVRLPQGWGDGEWWCLGRAGRGRGGGAGGHSPGFGPRPKGGMSPLAPQGGMSPSAAQRGVAPSRAQEAMSPLAANGGASLAVRWHDATTREALARFLARLVPGRAYAPGTLLSEAERLETQRRGMLDASWVLAMDGGDVVGGLCLERPPRRERRHVRRIHLDVLPAWQRCGAGASLVREALASSAERLGITRVEADPRAGNAGACRALERGGMSLAGVQRGAWRVRGPAGRVDEDVLFYSAGVSASAP